MFANICSQKHLDRFTVRTKVEVDIQWILFCMVHNLAKILHYGDISKISIMRA
ncbi:MAG: hypothetical protein GWN16_16115 [Calditrichae bacterium]|nr:hypothetical protein [Calditrichia bacterium]